MDETQSQWHVVNHDEALAKDLASSLQVPLPMARVLAGRGIGDTTTGKRFLEPSLSDISDPLTLPGVGAGVERILHALQQQERITVYGDYDCDGLTATTLLLAVLRQLGAVVDVFIPERVEDGFGFTLGTLDKVLQETHPGLIITADCGMRSHAAVEQARCAGIDVVIIDHHRPYGAPRPEAAALICPFLDGVPDAFQYLSAVGLAFTLCRALRERCITTEVAGAAALDLWHYLDLVAIGTISDLQWLQGENRILVHYGLGLLNDVTKRRPGILALMRAAGLRTEVGCYEVGFLMGPRLSAAGRLGNADLALSLLLAEDAMEARRLAGQLDACHRERRRIEDVVLQAAIDSVGDALDSKAPCLIAVGDEWHIGTIGIVAARLSGRFRRSAVVISFDKNGLGRGSCRSVGDLDLEQVFVQCADYLGKYGGHDSVAGFTIEKRQIAGFCKAFTAACEAYLDQEWHFAECHTVDAWVALSEANEALLDSLKALQPMGLGNQTPVWGVRNVRVKGPARIVGDNHLIVTLVCGTTERNAIGYGLGHRKLPDGPLDVLFQLQRNQFRGRSSLQLSIKDFRASSV